MASAFKSALPFWIGVSMGPIIIAAALLGGFWVLSIPFVIWYVFPTLDAVLGKEQTNPAPSEKSVQLKWHRLNLLLWPILQFFILFGLIAFHKGLDLNGWELIGLFFSLGVMTGTIGINYAHELMHQPRRGDRWLADILMAMVLYSHFRSEHLLVHHRYVGTPRDAVTARYNENVHRFFIRVLKASYLSAFRAEAQRLTRQGLAWYDLKNPFWIYWLLQLLMLGFAYGLVGFWGVLLFAFQAFIAVFHLELINYLEHYGLTRKYLGNGKYEAVQPHHSWNAEHRATNWLLINLQRHSDHHYKPARAYPLLHTYPKQLVPQLPYSYPIMGVIAVYPRLWRKFMNPKVKAWRAMHYPEISNWQPYNKGTNPPPN